jgi:hypothetical protein
MRKRHPNHSKSRNVLIDAETDAILQAIVDMPEGDLRKLVELADNDPKAFADFAKAIGRQNRPEVKAIIEAAKHRNNTLRP